MDFFLGTGTILLPPSLDALSQKLSSPTVQSRDSSVGIETGYGLDGGGVDV
jgi:hypothetical protein